MPKFVILDNETGSCYAPDGYTPRINQADLYPTREAAQNEVKPNGVVIECYPNHEEEL